MTTAAQGQLVLTFRVHEEDGQFVSRCAELGVASCGDTIQAAFDALLDATTLYLETIAEQGEQQRIFAERGIRVVADPRTGDGIEVRVCPNEYVSPVVIAIPLGAT